MRAADRGGAWEPVAVAEAELDSDSWSDTGLLSSEEAAIRRPSREEARRRHSPISVAAALACFSVAVILGACVFGSVTRVAWTAATAVDGLASDFVALQDVDVAEEEDLQGPDGDVPRCLGEPHAAQQLRGELLRSVCSHLGRGKDYLVFGNGYDSKFWMDSNPDGTTKFIEDRWEWIKYQPEQVQAASTLVNYSLAAVSGDPAALRLDHDASGASLQDFLQTQLPSDIKDRRWDVILVDGPGSQDTGGAWRGESIFAAASLAKDSAFVYVDDCERELEEAYVQRYFVDRGWTKAVHDFDGHGGTACVMFQPKLQPKEEKKRRRRKKKDQTNK